MNARMRARWIRAALEAHGDRLLRYAARVVGAERAQDVVQHTFMKLWEVDPPPTEDHLAPWLYTVCRRAAIDVHRKESRMQPQSAARLVAHEPRAETRAEASRVMGRIDALPEPQREVLRLRFQGGLAYKEIAEVVGKPIGTVSYLMHTGIRALRAEMGERS